MNICVLLMMGILASLGSYFLKKSSAGGFSIRTLLTTPWLYLGGILYTLSALLNLYLLRLLPYSMVIPLGSLTYIWTLIISNRLLGEPITRHKIEGIVLIVFGVVLMAIF